MLKLPTLTPVPRRQAMLCPRIKRLVPNDTVATLYNLHILNSLREYLSSLRNNIPGPIHGPPPI